MTVIIDSTAALIERAIGRNPVLGRPLGHGRMLLWRYEGDDLQRYERGRWMALEV